MSDPGAPEGLRQLVGDKVAAPTLVAHLSILVGAGVPLVVAGGADRATRDRIASEYGLTIVTLSPELSMEEQTEKYGVLYLTPDGQTKCCEMRKTDPLLKMKGRYDALVASLRRYPRLEAAGRWRPSAHRLPEPSRPSS